MQQHTEQFGDQTLGAYIDDELDEKTREAIIRAMEHDAGLRDRVYRLRRARDLMKLGFGAALPTSMATVATTSRRGNRIPLQLVAAVAALAISFGAGMLGQRQLEPRPGHAPLQLAAQQQTERIILHVSRSDPGQFRRAMDYTERFLREHDSNGNEIEVVAHASGLDLMRADVSPLHDRIIRIMQQHSNVHFVACANAISMLHEQGTEVRIIPGIATDATAFDHIVDRLQRGGWRYLKAEDLPEA